MNSFSDKLYLGRIYVEVASRVRQRLVIEVMSYWYSATAERLNAKDMIAIEIEQKKLEERNNLVSKDSFEYDFYGLKILKFSLRLNARRKKSRNS